MRAWLSHNLGWKLLSLLLAFLLWALVVGEQKVDVIMTAPLELQVPEHLALVTELPESLEIHLRGPRTLVTTLNRRDVVPSILPSRLTEGENIIQLWRDSVKVPRGIEVMGVSPGRVRLVLERVVQRQVEVQPRLEGKPAEGFVVRGVTASPAQVQVSGPASEMRRLTRVSTLPVSLEGKRASFTVQAILEPAGRQVRAQDDLVTVQVEIGPRRS
ncbi:MAG: YbbR-like domain-containing protein [Candidatus Methylomirabilales bacterium]